VGTADNKPVQNAITQRNANFELLRIVCMFMIVLGHSMTHSGLAESVTVFSLNWFLIQVLQSLIMVEVNCYVLISGYYLCESSFKAKRVLNLWGSAFFWSIVLTVTAYILSSMGIGIEETVGITDIIKAGLTVTSRRYWFVTSYILMYLFVPFLNSAIQAMDQKKHSAFLLMYFTVFIVIQNFAVWDEFTLSSAHSPLFFIFLYMTAAYIRKYPIRKRSWAIYYFLTVLAVIVWKIGITAITYSRFGMPIGETIFSGFRSIPGYLASVFLFIAFKELSLKKNRLSGFILLISPLTFGIYLIHDHTYIRGLLWEVIFPMSAWSYSSIVIPGALIATILIFGLCAVLEYFRKKAVSILCLDKISEAMCKELTGVWEKIVCHICR